MLENITQIEPTKYQKAMIALSQAKKGDVLELDLSGEKLSDEEIYRLMKAILWPLKLVTSINFSNCQLTVRQLQIIFCLLKEYQDDGKRFAPKIYKELLDKLKLRGHLGISLNLSSNDLGDQGAEFIRAWLNQNWQLEHAFNIIKALNLSENGIGPTVAIALSELREQRHELHSLQLVSHDRVHGFTVEQMEQYVKKNNIHTALLPVGITIDRLVKKYNRVLTQYLKKFDAEQQQFAKVYERAHFDINREMYQPGTSHNIHFKTIFGDNYQKQLIFKSGTTTESVAVDKAQDELQSVADDFDNIPSWKDFANIVKNVVGKEFVRAAAQAKPASPIGRVVSETRENLNGYAGMFKAPIFNRNCSMDSDTNSKQAEIKCNSLARAM